MAAQQITGQITINCPFTQTDSAGLVTPIQAAATLQYINTFLNTTGVANGIDLLYAQQLTLAGAATHINLHSFTDILSNTTQAMARVRYWSMAVLTLTAGFLVNVYTRSGTDPVTWLTTQTSGAEWCPPGGFICKGDPFSTSTNGWVVSSSAFDFTVDPGANTVVCNVIIAGNSGA